MSKTLIIAAVILIAAIGFYYWQQSTRPVGPMPTPLPAVTPTPAFPNPTLSPSTTPNSSTPPNSSPSSSPDVSSLIKVTSPQKNAQITSPLTITGQARGTWYFEATFPVLLKNTAGATIAESFATAQGEWMTENLVPFTATLSFPKQTTGTKGTLVFMKANASGLPENDDSYEIPVTFK